MVRRAGLAAALLLALLAPAAGLTEPRRITSEDLLGFVWIGDPQVSPDGARVAFVRITVNAKRDGYDTSIWSVPVSGGEAPHALTSGTHDSAPRWSPDGRYLLFLRAAEQAGKPRPGQLWILPLAGGDSFALTDLPRAASSPVWSPDATQIAFLSATGADDLAKQAAARVRAGQAAAAEGNADASAPEMPESDVHVITRADYRTNDEGYVDFKHPEHIWLIATPQSSAEHGMPRQLTAGRFAEANIVWALDGARLYFTSNHDPEPYYELPRSELYVQGVHGGDAIRLASIPMEVRSPALSPDGTHLAFIAESTRPINSYTQPDLWVLETTAQTPPRNLTAGFDWDVGAGLLGDNAPPRALGADPPIWSADGRTLIVSYLKQGRANLAAFDASTGAETDLTADDQAVLSYRRASSGALIYTSSSAMRIGELFAIDRRGAAPRQLTHLNDALFGMLELSAPEELWYRSFDGRRIQAWVQKPPDFDAHRKYPLVLDIHGGPHAAYGHVFDHEFHWLAAKGYVVLYPNPRGSTGYGQAFGNIIQYHYPGDDFKDLMAGVDELVRRGYVDAGKLGVTGGSGGGLLTNWVVGHTTRFAAAVAQRDIADWADWWYSSDIVFFHPNWFRAPPFQDAADYRARSPISYVDKVTTPLMLVLGEADSRTPPDAGGEQMFRALKFRHVPTVMVRFPNETHELSRSGQPRHRVERLEHIGGWFDRWLLGVAKPEYDAAAAP